MSTDGMSRRSALTAGGIVAAGAVGGYVFARNTDAADAKDSTTAANAYGDTPAGGQALATVADIPDGGGTVLDKPAVVITRTGNDVHAFSAVCPHQGCRVDRVAGGTINCPCHGSRFDAVTGKVVGGPSPRPLPPVAVTVRNGQVFSA